MVMEAGARRSLEEQLRGVVRKCQAQQETLRWQRTRLEVQHLKLIRVVIKVNPDETGNDTGAVSLRRD